MEYKIQTLDDKFIAEKDYRYLVECTEEQASIFSEAAAKQIVSYLINNNCSCKLVLLNE
jgi:hypothetical protein